MSQTQQNLCKAFVGESQARNRYSFYSKIAKNEGYEQIAEIFEKTADNEREHAKWLYKLIKQLQDKPSENVEADVPITMGTTEENLQAAINGENYENTQMYPGFAKTAEEEGYPEIAARLRSIAVAEEHHEQKFKKALKEIQENTFFKKEEKVTWYCRKCGYAHEGEEPPEACPSCSHPKGYFESEAIL